MLCIDLQAEVCPPCRTVSALSHQEDGGPGILRTEEHPYGLPTLSSSEQALVAGDSVLLYRTLALYMLRGGRPP